MVYATFALSWVIAFVGALTFHGCKRRRINETSQRLTIRIGGGLPSLLGVPFATGGIAGLLQFSEFPNDSDIIMWQGTWIGFSGAAAVGIWIMLGRKIVSFDVHDKTCTLSHGLVIPFFREKYSFDVPESVFLVSGYGGAYYPSPFAIILSFPPKGPVMLEEFWHERDAELTQTRINEFLGSKMLNPDVPDRVHGANLIP